MKKLNAVHKKFRSKKGFTLVELLVAMAITSVMSLGAFMMMITVSRNFDNAVESNENQQSSVILEIRLHTSVSTASYVNIVKANTKVKKGDLVLMYEGSGDDCMLKLYEITKDSHFMDNDNKKVQQIFHDISEVNFELRLITDSSYKLDYKISTNENGMNYLQGGIVVNSMREGDLFGVLKIEPYNNVLGLKSFTTSTGINSVFGLLIRPSNTL